MILAVLGIWGIRHLSDFLIVRDDGFRPDLVVALSGDSYRLHFAAKALHEFHSEALLTFYPDSETVQFGKKFDVPAALREHAARLHVDSSKVFIRGRVQSTFDEACATRDFLRDNRERKFDSLLVVTTIYHTYRSRWVFRRVLGDSIRIGVRGIPPEVRGLHPETWWREENDLLWVFTELSKTMLYWVQY